MSVAAVIRPPLAAVAAMERASIRHTPANWPSAGLDPSRLGEVPGGVPQAQAVVGRHVSRAEAGAAEAGLDDGAGGQQVRRGADLRQLQD